MSQKLFVGIVFPKCSPLRELKGSQLTSGKLKRNKKEKKNEIRHYSFKTTHLGDIFRMTVMNECTIDFFVHLSYHTWKQFDEMH